MILCMEVVENPREKDKVDKKDIGCFWRKLMAVKEMKDLFVKIVMEFFTRIVPLLN